MSLVSHQFCPCPNMPRTLLHLSVCDVVLLGLDEGPNLITLDTANAEIADVGIVIGGSSATQASASGRCFAIPVIRQVASMDAPSTRAAMTAARLSVATRFTVIKIV